MGKNKRKKENQKIIRANNKQRKNKKHSKKHKDTNMAWWNGKDQKVTSYANRWNKTKPTTGQQNDTLSVMLYKQSVLDEIAALCKPKAGGSEFQVHCRGVQIFIKKPESDKRLVFTLPTYYFNMPQKVSTGSVDFNLDEVSEISNQIAPMSAVMGEEIVSKFPLAFFEELGFEISVRELEMGSLHRHPGDFGFSGTDLDNQVEKPGVIFRNLKCQDKVQVDSVMYIPTSHVKIVTTETRVVSVQPTEDNEGIEGTYETAPTLCYIIKDQDEAPVGFGEFFHKKVEPVEGEVDFKIDQFQTKEEHDEITQLLQTFLNEMDYSPQLIIDPELIVQEFTRNVTYNKGTKPYNNRYGAHDPYNYYGQMDDDDDETYSVVTNPMLDGAQKSGTGGVIKPAPAMTVRPTWRKTQALGLLTAKGVDVKGNINITGNASDEDVIAIVTELKALELSDDVCRAFFTTCDYPKGSIDLYYTDLAAKAGIN